jgi:hypothetical protein
VDVLRLERSLRDLRRPLLLYIGVMLAIAAVTTSFRWLYFKDVLPNTFYAKMDLYSETVLSYASRMYHLVTGLSSPRIALPFFVFILATTIFLARRKTFDRDARVHLSFLVVSTGAYLLLPTDWMGELRFATPVFFFLYLFFFWLLSRIVDLVPSKSSPLQGSNIPVAAKASSP